MTDLEKMLGMEYDEEEVRGNEQWKYGSGGLLEPSSSFMVSLDEKHLQDLHKLALDQLQRGMSAKTQRGSFSIHYLDHETYLSCAFPEWKDVSKDGDSGKLLDFLKVTAGLMEALNAKASTITSGVRHKAEKIGEFTNVEDAKHLRKFEADELAVESYKKYLRRVMDKQRDYGFKKMYYHVVFCEKDTQTIYVNDFPAPVFDLSDLVFLDGDDDYAHYTVGNADLRYVKNKNVIKMQFAINRDDPRRYPK